jgi:hypothetical protein
MFYKRSAPEELYRLCKKLEIDGLIICRLSDVKKYMKDKDIKCMIINLDKTGNGTHWVAISKDKKKYFDSYAQDKPKEIPKDYTLASSTKQLQSMTAKDCGWLCCLWLYYIQYKNNKEYYDLFKDVYNT